MTDTPNTVTTPSQRGSTAPLPAEETERSPAARIDPLGGLADDTATHEELVDAVARLAAVRGQIRALEDERRDLEELLKAALEDRRNDPIVDGERGLVARLQERRLPAEVDLISFAEKPENEKHLARAARMGLLKAQLTPLRQQKGKVDCADALLAFEMPGGVTYRVEIDEVR